MEQVLLEILKKHQKKEGYLSEKTLKKISKETNIPISRIYGVATFYSMLDTKETGKNIIEICSSQTCFLKGGETLEKFLREELNIKNQETTKDKLFTLKKTSCIGCCDKAPALILNKEPITNLTKSKIKKILKNASNKKN